VDCILYFEIKYNNIAIEIGISKKQQSANTIRIKTTWYSRLAIIFKSKIEIIIIKREEKTSID
jgi:hypothetical protein